MNQQREKKMKTFRKIKKWVVYGEWSFDPNDPNFKVWIDRA